MTLPLRLGTRGSPLALTQARMVAAGLRAAHRWHDADIEIVVIRTTGDRVQDRPLAEIGGKALWTKELDRALFEDEIDIAVHSLKDVETIRTAALGFVAILPRADVRDRLIGAESIVALAEGARVGTSSPRRAAQILRLRPDCTIVPFRGNVDTRLSRLALGEADATLLAAAGLDRLGRADIGVAIPTSVMLPAASQGAVAVEALAARADVGQALAAIDDAATRSCVLAERALLAALGADCHSPVAALAVIEDGAISIRAELFSGDGREHVAGARLLAVPAEAARLADRLLAEATPALRALFAGR